MTEAQPILLYCCTIPLLVAAVVLAALAASRCDWLQTLKGLYSIAAVEEVIIVATSIVAFPILCIVGS